MPALHSNKETAKAKEIPPKFQTRSEISMTVYKYTCLQTYIFTYKANETKIQKKLRLKNFCIFQQPDIKKLTELHKHNHHNTVWPGIKCVMSSQDFSYLHNAIQCTSLTACHI